MEYQQLNRIGCVKCGCRTLTPSNSFFGITNSKRLISFITVPIWRTDDSLLWCDGIEFKILTQFVYSILFEPVASLLAFAILHYIIRNQSEKSVERSVEIVSTPTSTRHWIHAFKIPLIAIYTIQLTVDYYFIFNFSYDMVHFGHANSLRQAKALGKRSVLSFFTSSFFYVLIWCNVKCFAPMTIQKWLLLLLLIDNVSMVRWYF